MSKNSDSKLDQLISELKKQELYQEQIFHIEKIEKKPPVYGKLKDENLIDDRIKKWLEFNDMDLYTHQADAINTILEDRNTIIVTPTASGKSLAYNIPVLNSLLKKSKENSLYIFPQKALSQDQYIKLKSIFDFMNIPQQNIGIYDGDTSQSEKARIRQEARLIITNPFGLHWYLPFKHLWMRFWKSLKYIIIDECHQYRGIFGSNFAQVIRRLLRILKSLDVRPIFILGSATINNPEELASKLTGQKKFSLIDNDGAPNSGRLLILWDLPFIEGSDKYKSPHTQTRNVFNFIIKNHLQTLAFTRSRKMAELNAFFSKSYFKSENNNLFEKIVSYRAGLSPIHRRDIENGLREKKIMGVYATNALELGIDIGSLQCTILSGFPGTISSMWQQIGRAGRNFNSDIAEEALSFLIPMPNPLDLYYIHHPNELLTKVHEHCNINVDNKYILENHVKCAAKEKPLMEIDKDLFGNRFEATVNKLEEKGDLKKKGNRYFYNASDSFPPSSVNLSGIMDKGFKVILKQNNSSSPIIIYEENSYVFKELHEGAVYLYMANPYKVVNFDIDNKEVILIPDDGATYTNSKVMTDLVQIGKPSYSKIEQGINIYYGDVQVTEKIVSYDVFSVETNEKIVNKPLNLPSLKLDTKSLWFSIPPELIEKLESEGYNFEGSIHGFEHSLISMAPYFTMCDRWDIGGISTRDGGLVLSNWPVIYIYDGFPGGIGITETLYDLLISLIKKTKDLIKSCRCQSGCPGCIQSPKCGNNNEPLDKLGAIKLINLLLKEKT